MNEFNKTYLNIINEWNSNILLEATLKSLIPNIQQELLHGKEYKDLDDIEKQDLEVILKSMLDQVENDVYKITDNKQYQSWIYEILKNKEVPIIDLSPIKSVLMDFIKLCKRPDLKPNQRNIQNYPTLKDLREFINSFKSEHKLQNGIYFELKQIYKNSEFTIYFINKDQFDECNKLFGGNEYFNTGWCVAKNENHFNSYIYEHKDKYNGYFVFIKDNKPFALLHYGSGQFKDTSDESIKIDDKNIIDCLLHINNNIKEYNKSDLNYYCKLLFNQQNPNATKEDFIAFQIGGTYDPKTKIIDCKWNRVDFKDDWLDENGTFDFTFINIMDCVGMFSDCRHLRKLPDNFTIPKGVNDCFGMFDLCYELEELPNIFTIPNGVVNCNNMFSGCHSLKKLPDNFSIANSVSKCRAMFEDCRSLSKLPDNFKLPTHIKMANRMFNYCENLIELPETFILPNGIIECNSLFGNCYKLIKLPENFIIPSSVKNCMYMFYNCYSLGKLPEGFSIPSNASYTDIFTHSALDYKVKANQFVK